MGRNASRAEFAWRSRMARYRRSAVTVAEFCRREGVSAPSFYAWRRRLDAAAQPTSRRQSGGAAPGGAKASDLFVPVQVVSPPVAEIEFPNGVRVRVPATNIEAMRAAILAGGDPVQEDSSC